MKITFIFPCVGKRKGVRYPQSWLMEPLAIAQLSALTPATWERDFYDDRLETIPRDLSPDLVAINVETYTARRAYQIARRYRDKGVPVVMGGFHPTLAPDEAVQHADAIVVGEAEGVWQNLLADLAAGKLKQRYAGDRPALGGLRPDRSIYAGKPYLELSLVETGRGCLFGCEFCSIAGFFHSSYSARPIEDVVEEVKTLRNKTVFFVDDNFCVDRDRTRRLLEALIPLRIRWMGQVSIRTAQDEDLLILMRKSGCAGVLIGFESLDPALLAAMRKTMNPDTEEECENAVKRFYKHGIGIYATFVFGYDTDTKRSFQRTLDFAIRNRFFFTAFNHLVPFPGTPLYTRLKMERRLIDDPWWLSDSFRFGDLAFEPTQMSAREMARLCFEYRQRFYCASSILRRAMNFHTNFRSAFMAGLYLSQNFAARNDVDNRQGLPLGIPGEDR